MITIATQDLEALRNEVIVAAGISEIRPAHCGLLTVLIENKTRQQLSETTLKRLYGFAYTKFNPSIFTIDILAKFCNYTNTEDFLKQRHVQIDQTRGVSPNWLNVKHHAEKTSHFTIQTIKHRAEIPYKYTIARKFINNHFLDFIDSEYAGTIIAAPAGYGKTIALCHWADDFLTHMDANDILLLFSSNAMSSIALGGPDLNCWLQTLLGFELDQSITELNEVERSDGKFYLVIDGFDEFLFKPEQYNLIARQLSDLMSNNYDWLKVVLTMRSASWINSRHKLEIGNNKWHTGFHENDSCSNVPLLDLQEINELGANINPVVLPLSDTDIINNFGHPLYFQYYYKQHCEGFSFSNLDKTLSFELSGFFILNKIYTGPLADDKMELIHSFVGLMDIENGNYQLPKAKAVAIIKQFSRAYRDLLSIGFLVELNISSQYLYNSFIKFSSTDFLSNSIAKYLLFQNNYSFDLKLIEQINNCLKDGANKISVLKWCVIYAIKTGQQGSLDKLSEVNFNSVEKLDFILFLGELLSKECLTQDALNFKQTFGAKLFDYFFGIELISPEYRKTLNSLLKFDLSDKDQILIHTTLSIISIVSLNLDDLEKSLADLRTLQSDDMQFFAINPLLCLEGIYDYLKYGKINKAAVKELTQFSFNFPQGPKHRFINASNDVIYILGLYTSLLTGNQRKTLRLINIVKANYNNKGFIPSTTEFDFFVNILTAEAYFNLNKKADVNQLYYNLSDSYKKNRNALTPYMKTLFYCLKIRLLLGTSREEEIYQIIKGLRSVINSFGSKLSELAMVTLLLKTDGYLIDKPDFKKQLIYDRSKLIRQYQLTEHLFSL